MVVFILGYIVSFEPYGVDEVRIRPSESWYLAGCTKSISPHYEGFLIWYMCLFRTVPGSGGSIFSLLPECTRRTDWNNHLAGCTNESPAVYRRVFHWLTL